MNKEIIAKFDSIYKMVSWILDNPEYSDVGKYPTEVVGTEYFIIRSK